MTLLGIGFDIAPKIKRVIIIKTQKDLSRTRFERITFRSGVERATVAPAARRDCNGSPHPKLDRARNLAHDNIREN